MPILDGHNFLGPEKCANCDLTRRAYAEQKEPKPQCPGPGSKANRKPQQFADDC
jgi:hypothetical protein